MHITRLRYPGRPLRAGEVVPGSVVGFVASQVGADPDAFHDYAGGIGGAGRDTTGREHVALTGVYRWDLGAAPSFGELRPLCS